MMKLQYKKYCDILNIRGKKNRVFRVPFTKHRAPLGGKMENC